MVLLVQALQVKETLEVLVLLAHLFPAVLEAVQALRGLLFQTKLWAVMAVQGYVAQLQAQEFFTLAAVVVHLAKQVHWLTPGLVAQVVVALEAHTVILQVIDTPAARV
jgi:hypothetical protein